MRCTPWYARWPRQFGRHLARGREYFHPAREIIDYINVVRDDMGVPALPF